MKINAIITGATGMVGKGVLYECLESEQVESVLMINRRTLGINHPKLKELIPEDMFDLSPYLDELKGYNACFFCLGISSATVSAEEYEKITYRLCLHFAETLFQINPDMCFNYVSGTGTSSAETSRMKWANVKGKTENHILRMGFRDAYMFRPGYIHPMKGITSRTKLYRIMYILMTPLYPVLKFFFPSFFTTTVKVGKAMIHSVIYGFAKKHLENRDINVLADLNPQ